MLLCIDAGNTNIVFGIFNGNHMIAEWRFATNQRKTADEYAIDISKMLELKSLNFADIQNVIISSVVPQIMFQLKSFIRSYLGVEPLIIGDGINIEINIDVDNPKEVGADRLVNAYAAYIKYKSASIIVDFGTATTFDAVNDAGTYIGGVISPGINLSLEALHNAAAKLPKITITQPKQVIGRSTIDAMQSGVFYGYLGLTETIIKNIKREYGSDMKVVATGGLATLFTGYTDIIEIHDPSLTMFGLKEVFENAYAYNQDSTL